MTKPKSMTTIIVTAIISIAITLLFTMNVSAPKQVSAETQQPRTHMKTYWAVNFQSDAIPTKIVDKQVNKFLKTHDGKIVNSSTTTSQGTYTYTVTIEY